MSVSPIRVLLVEDNPGDCRLVREALADYKLKLEVKEVHDGEAAMAYLHREGEFRRARRPDLILLDLNIPKKDGREVLAEVKVDRRLKQIPVVILTSSQAEEDILRTYELHANCYISKPIDLEQLQKVVRQIKEFWFTIVKLPPEN
ncbi:MAG TPA: response regulator [Candidatus Acidoferrum sp.]|nr:response regulator [Candidatus Acidoferrum sp.]